MSPPIGRIPRWIVENDPTWEKSTDTSPTVLIWNKKGLNVRAISYPGSIYCDISRQVPDEAQLSDVLLDHVNNAKPDVLAGGNFTRYLSSRYLNPRIGRVSGLDNML